MFKSKGKKAENTNERNSTGTLTWEKNKVTKKTRNSEFKASLQQTKGSLNAENIYSIVVLPNKPESYEENYDEEMEEIHEWWAENTVDFYNELCVLHGVLTDKNEDWMNICQNPDDFDNEGYPKGVKYLWKSGRDDHARALPIDVYLDHVIVWINTQLEDENIFPTDEDVAFSPEFKHYIKKMYKRMFRIFAIFFSHECLYENSEVKEQLDICFRHYLYFCWKWKLLDEQETKCIDKIVKPIRNKFKRDEKLYKEGKLPRPLSPSK